MGKLTGTHTVVALEVSPGVYEEIGGALRAAGWDHAFHSGGIDVTGLLLIQKQSSDPTRFCPGCRDDSARELTALLLHRPLRAEDLGSAVP